MSNANRDAATGRWSSANIGVHTPSDAANGGAPNITDTPTANRPGSGVMAPAASIAHDDDWGGPSQTSALLGHTGAGRGSGMASAPIGPVQPRDYSAANRSLGLGSNEIGGGQMKTSQGPGNHSDVPQGGVPGPTDPGVPGGAAPAADAAGGAEAAGAEAGLEELAPLALGV